MKYNGLRIIPAVVAMAALLTACGDDDPTEPADTTAAPTPSPTRTLPDADTTEVAVESDLFGQLIKVRVGKHPGYDRVVFEFAKDMPGYTVKYVDLPVLEDGSGEPIDLPGADSAVQIVFTPASGFDMDAGEPTYKGPKTITNDETVEMTGVVRTGDFEAMLSWAVGLRHEVPFRVTKFDHPARLIVDFQTK